MHKTPSRSLDLPQFESRKQSHLEISLQEAVQASEQAAFDRITLEHDALPEIDFEDVSIETSFLSGARKVKLATPFFVCGMTAGHASARSVNERLAKACAKRGWIFGVGSQRRELDEKRPLIDSWSSLKSEAPGLVVLGNLGLAQVVTTPASVVEKLVKNLTADAFCVHLNALQEVIQPEGTPQFKGGMKALKALSTKLSVPLVLKETGCGFSEKTLKKIRAANFGSKLVAIDVSGLGGTHWGRIEGVRAKDEGSLVQATAAETFRNWGSSTIDSVLNAVKILPKTTEVWASGGVRSGLDAAKLISIGATRVGFAKPALEAALKSEEALELWMETVEFELRTALFCTGARSLADLRSAQKPKKTSRK